MKKLLNSFFTLFMAFFVSYISVYILVCNFSESFAYYVKRRYGIGISVFSRLFNFALVFGLIAFVLLILSAWQLMEKGSFLGLILKSSLFGASLTAAFALLLLVYGVYLQINTFLTIILFPFLSYLVFVLWMLKVLAFIKGNDRYKNISWWKFYKQFPLPHPISLTLSISLLIFIIFFLLEIVDFSIRTFNRTFFFSLLTLVGLGALTVLAEYLSRYAQGKEEVYEKAMQDKLKAERLKTELITNVSHDIKTPLTSIINYADLIHHQGVNANDLKEYTTILYKKSLRLKVLIEDLIEASKAGTGNISMQVETINLCELIGQILGEYDEQMANKGLQLLSQIPETELYIKADGRYLWRVLENIFSNAVKYSQEGTRIYAELKVYENVCSFVLKNISKEPLNLSATELMEQFVRGDRARLTEGSGLGLYIARSLTEAMGGEFLVQILGDLYVVEIRFGLLHEKVSAKKTDSSFFTGLND